MPSSDEANKPIIVCRDVWKSYNGFKVLKGLNLEVMDGETLVILGRSGGGKSVLLRQILGIERPENGYIEIGDKRISQMNQKKRFKITMNMGMLFQSAALFDSMDVGENTAFYLHQHLDNLGKKEIKRRVSEALEMVGLEGTESKMPADLSGGMRKRAALARLIVYRPHIILYDEPTAGLDPITAMQINELINSIKKELKSTSIVVTHDLVSAMHISDRLAFHHEGIIKHIAPRQEFFKNQDPTLQAFFNNASIFDPKHPRN